MLEAIRNESLGKTVNQSEDNKAIEENKIQEYEIECDNSKKKDYFSGIIIEPPETKTKFNIPEFVSIEEVDHDTSKIELTGAMSPILVCPSQPNIPSKNDSIKINYIHKTQFDEFIDDRGEEVKLLKKKKNLILKSKTKKAKNLKTGNTSTEMLNDPNHCTEKIKFNDLLTINDNTSDLKELDEIYKNPNKGMVQEETTENNTTEKLKNIWDY